MELPVRFGTFELSAPLAAGGMGSVWLGVDVHDGTPAAIKVLDQARSGARLVDAMEAEIRAVARLSHPNVVRILDAGITPALVDDRFVAGTPWLAMELCTSTIGRQKRSWPAVREILVSVLDALCHAHSRGILHRDIKPANVLVTDGRVRVSDFGLAHVLGTPSEPGGTPGYMAPEQWAGDWRSQGPWTDLYAVGRLAAALLTGVSPKRTLEIPALPMVPTRARRCLQAMLRATPTTRMRHAADALAALDAEPTLDSALAPSRGLGLFGARETPFVGRDEVRTQLWSALETLPRAAVLLGPAGVGKTRLSEWLARRVLASGRAQVVRMAHPTEGADGLADGVRRVLQLQGASAELVESVVGERVPDPQHAAVLANLVLGNASARRLARFAAVGELLRVMSAERPILVVVDDAQWGADAVRFVQWLLDRQLPILAVLTVRDADVEDDAVDRLLEHPRATDHVLEPLSAGEERALVDAMLPLDAGASDRLARRAAGNPLFLVQLVEDWVSRNVIVRRQGVFGVVESTDSLPPSIRALWERRLSDVVPDDGWDALEIAATLGVAVDAFEWHAACEAAGVDVPRGLVMPLVAAGLLELDASQPMQRWSFVHGLLRDALVDRAVKADRARRWHGACADVVAEGERKANHLLAAGRRAEALDPLWQAGLVRLQFDDDGAIRLWKRRLEALADLPRSNPEWPRTLLALSHACRKRGHGAEALEWGQRALDWAQVHDDPDVESAVYVEFAADARLGGRLGVCLDYLIRARGLATKPSYVLELEEVFYLHETGNWEASLEPIRRALALDLNTHRRIEMLSQLSTTLGRVGRKDDQSEVIEEVMQLLGTGDFPEMQSTALINRGEARRLSGDLDGAVEDYIAARTLGERFQILQHLDAVAVNLGMVRLAQGRWADAAEHLDHGLAITGSLIVRLVALAARAVVAMELGDPPEPFVAGLEAMPEDLTEPDAMEFLQRLRADLPDGSLRIRVGLLVQQRT